MCSHPLVERERRDAKHLGRFGAVERAVCIIVEQERAMAKLAGARARAYAVGLTPFEAFKRGLEVENQTILGREKIVGSRIINEASRLDMCEAFRNAGKILTKDEARQCR